MFHSGHSIAERMDITDDSQVQPNGVDLKVSEVYRFNGNGEIRQDGKEITERTEVQPTERDVEGDYVLDYKLSQGSYIVVYDDVIEIPKDSIGFVLPRSSLIRNGSMLYTAVWDAGYKGQGEGMLQVMNPIRIERKSRIGQLIIADANTEEEYSGSYQNERI